MSQFSTSGAVTAAITGNVATGIPAGATLISVDSGPTNFGTTTDLYTVGAGKTLMITAAWINAYSSAAGQTQARIQADMLGTGTYYPVVAAMSIGLAGSVGVGSNCASYTSAPVSVPATKKVQIQVITSGAASGGFMGYLI